MGRWSQANRRGGSGGTNRSVRPVSAVLSQSAPGNGIELLCTVTPAADRIVARIWDVAAPTVDVAAQTTTNSTTNDLFTGPPIVGHTYAGSFQAYKGPYVTTVQLSNTVVAA